MLKQLYKSNTSSKNNRPRTGFDVWMTDAQAEALNNMYHEILIQGIWKPGYYAKHKANGRLTKNQQDRLKIAITSGFIEHRGAIDGRTANAFFEICKAGNQPYIKYTKHGQTVNISLDLISTDKLWRQVPLAGHKFVLRNAILPLMEDIQKGFEFVDSETGKTNHPWEWYQVYDSGLDIKKLQLKHFDVIMSSLMMWSRNAALLQSKHAGWLEPEISQKEKPMAVQFFKQGTALALQTDCASEELFVEQFCGQLAEVIELGEHSGEWEFHLRHWLPQYVELCNAYRGYKAKVTTKTVYTAGEITPGEPLYEVKDVSGLASKNGAAMNGAAKMPDSP